MSRVLIALSRLHCMDGIASHLATLLPALQRQGWQSHILVGLVDCPLANQITLDRIKQAAETFDCVPCLAATRLNAVRQIAAQAIEIRAALNRYDIKVIHLHGRGLAPAARLARRGRAIGIVNVAHLANPPGMTIRQSAAALLSGWVWGDRVVAISTEMKNAVNSNWGVPSCRLRLVNHGSDLSRFRPPTSHERSRSRNEFGCPEGAFVISQIARVGAIKRPDTVVAATARLAKESRDVRAIFAGHCDPSERRRLERQAAELGIGDCVLILGHVDARDVLWASDVKVLASEREGFPLAIIEAMACGVVPVRTPVEGSVDQIDDRENGLLFPVGDDAALADRLRLLMDHPEERQCMANVAQRKAVERFSDDAMASGTIAVYHELIGEERTYLGNPAILKTDSA